MRLIDRSNNVSICESCPVYGTQKDAPGNEKGYLVEMKQDFTNYTVSPGLKVESCLVDAFDPLACLGLKSYEEIRSTEMVRYT